MKRSYKKPKRITLKDRLLAFFKEKKKIKITKVKMADIFGEDPRSLHHALKGLEAEGKIQIKTKKVENSWLTSEYIYKRG